MFREALRALEMSNTTLHTVKSEGEVIPDRLIDAFCEENISLSG